MKHQIRQQMFFLTSILLLSGCTITSNSVESSNENTSHSITTSINETEDTTLTIFSVNDLHGAIETKDDKGLAYISSYLEQARQVSDNVLFLSAGDALQGTAISNLYQGATVIESLNLAKLDAFIVGNHEFDWGLDLLETYQTGQNSYNVTADYPFLGANIYDKATQQRVDFMDPYTILTKGNIDVGIIGVIGQGLETSIATNRVSAYEFVDPLPIVKDLTKELKEEKGVEVIVVVTHNGSDAFNHSLSTLQGEFQVDAVINGHSHRTYEELLTRTNAADMPVIQSGSSGNNLGKITLSIDGMTKKVVDSTVENVYISAVSNTLTPHQEIEEYLDAKLLEIAPTIHEVLGTAGETIYREEATKWGAQVIKAVTGADLAFTNSGGIRSSAFPIYSGEEVIYDRMLEVMPFDNYIKTTKISGQKLMEFQNASYGIIYSDDITINPSQTYTIATVDFVFDYEDNPFVAYGQDTINTGLLFRDVMMAEIREACQENQLWYPSRYTA